MQIYFLFDDFLFNFVVKCNNGGQILSLIVKSTFYIFLYPFKRVKHHN